ncbi:hypothetical protein MKY07_05785 [Solibacillus sp. FSL W7-1472]|uniref:hypothetical protein n=1 Tax=Solibacillus sp. FSL W7-1472 TaxID=2921707 RepID=UPI0007FB3166|nr:hypothetical protein [Solibacillus silvestris]OBW56643.1 hypothetical protein A9986_11705 [Solibacillus silvestris]
MRNSIEVNGLVVSIDNSGCIGTKEHDIVQVPNEVTAYFTARTAILEQLCAGAIPVQLLMANFSGDDVWSEYEQGFKRAFSEMGLEMPPLMGSSETNFQSLQSAVSLTMLGKKQFERNTNRCEFYVIGEPLVGNDVIENPHKIAQLNEVYEGLINGIIQAIWPTGSKGVGAEITRFAGESYTTDVNLTSSAGPSCAVLAAVKNEHEETFLHSITAPVRKLIKAKE